MDGNIVLVPLVRTEIEFIRLVRNKPEINEWLFTDCGPISKQQQRLWFEHVTNDKNHLVWIAKTAQWRSVGYVQAKDIDHHYRSACVGYVVAPEFQGRGYGQKMVRLSQIQVARMLGLHRLEARVLSNNERAIHIYRKLGFETEGLLRDAIKKGRRFYDVVIMGYICTEREPEDESEYAH